MIYLFNAVATKQQRKMSATKKETLALTEENFNDVVHKLESLELAYEKKLETFRTAMEERYAEKTAELVTQQSVMASEVLAANQAKVILGAGPGTGIVGAGGKAGGAKGENKMVGTLRLKADVFLTRIMKDQDAWERLWGLGEAAVKSLKKYNPNMNEIDRTAWASSVLRQLWKGDEKFPTLAGTSLAKIIKDLKEEAAKELDEKKHHAAEVGQVAMGQANLPPTGTPPGITLANIQQQIPMPNVGMVPSLPQAGVQQMGVPPVQVGAPQMQVGGFPQVAVPQVGVPQPVAGVGAPQMQIPGIPQSVVPGVPQQPAVPQAAIPSNLPGM